MFRGSAVALVTPFHEDGNVNYKRMRELIDWHIEQGTNAILVLGTTGETPTLTLSEEEEIVRIAVDQAKGRIPIIAGSGTNNTAATKERSIKYANMGADALLVITPYYNKTNKEGMIRHFFEVADAVDKPIIVYNIPGRSGVCMTYDELAEVSQHKNIVGIKEASGNMSLICKYSKLINENFNLYSGNDDINVPLLSMGGAGVISVLANMLPKETNEMAMAYLNGDVKKARDMQVKYLDLINALFIETNPIPIKEAMNMMGLNVGGYRLPLCPMSDPAKAVLKDAMQKLGLL